MEPILSAAAVVWRRAPQPEVLLARRRPRMRFFGGVHAFCGGKVDPVDERIAAAEPDEDRLVATLRSTVARELLEELSLDLCTGRAIDPERARAVARDPDEWEQWSTPAGLRDLPRPCLRLVTPEFYPRRFDTWFFVTEVEAGFSPVLDPAELDGGGFDRPGRWLERWHEGEFLLAPPTVVMLQALAAHPPEEWENALLRTQREVEDPSTVPEIRTDPAVRLLSLRTPTLPPARHTNAYLVGEHEAWLVDPATPWADEQARLAATLDSCLARGATLQGVLLTHEHADHVGAATFVSRRFGVPVAAHAETARRLSGRVEVHRTLEDGARLPFGHADGARGTLRALLTPGHASGHLCYLEERYRGLIAGDMVSTLSSILIDPDDGDMGEYLRSLESLAGLQLRCVYPAHGPADGRGAALLTDQLEHRRARAQAVLEVVREGPIDLDTLTVRVWGDVPRPMMGYARKSAEAVLALLAREGRVDVGPEGIRPV